MSMEKQTVGKSTTKTAKSTESTSTGPSEFASQPMSLFGILEDGLKASNMDALAEEHLAQFMVTLNSKKIKAEYAKIPFASFEAVFVYNKPTSLGIIFIYDNGDGAPLINYHAEIFKTVKKSFPDISITEMVVIPAIDYPKAKILAEQVYSVIAVPREQWRTNIQLLKNTTMIVTNKPSHVDRIFRELCPHTVQARRDYGIGIYLAKGEPKMINGEYDYSQLIPFMGISGYNKFIPDTVGGVTKFIPVATISEIVSKINDPGLLGLALPLAIDRFINGPDWLLPYRSYDDNRPNMGNLVTDAAGKMLKIVNDSDRAEFIAKFTHPVYFAIDVVEGRFRIPALERFDTGLAIDGQTMLRELIAGFLGVHIQEIPRIDKGVIPGVIGIIDGVEKVSAGWTDSRYVDYLNMAITIKNPEKLMPFMIGNLGGSGGRTLNSYISGMFGSFREMYPAKTVVIDPIAAKAIQSCARGLMVFYDVDKIDKTGTTVDIGGLFNLGQRSTSEFSGGSFGTGPGSPFNQGPGVIYE